MADKGHNIFRFEGVDKLLLVLLTVGVIDLDGPEMLPESMFVCFAEVSVENDGTKAFLCVQISATMLLSLRCVCHYFLRKTLCIWDLLRIS